MATDEKGSDLDVFEGLSKKAGSGLPSTAPPPPPGMAPQQTLLGMAAPSSMPESPPPLSEQEPEQPEQSEQEEQEPEANHSGPAAAAAADGSAPNLAGAAPPPPGRGSLPPIDPVAPAFAAPQAPPRPSVDVDWDDEDEATHIFDKGDDVPRRSVPLPAAGMPAPLAVGKSTLLGLTPPPVARLTPPPAPPAPGGLLGRPSSIPPTSGSSLPPPPVGTFPPPSMTLHGLGGVSQSRSFPPPPAIPNVGATTMPPLRAFASDHPGVRSSMRSEETMLRAPPSRMQMMGLGTLVLALVVAVILLLVPHGGRAIVNVTDPRGASVGRVDIYVDGQKTKCETAPCIVESLSTGSHEVKALAEGYDVPPVQTINVESHKDSLATIVLGGAPKGTGIKVSGTQPGVKLYVDDKEIGPLPQDFREMTPGDHVVRIIGSERYQPLERRVTLEKDRVEDLGAVTLKVLKGKATISLATPGARVYLVAGSDRRELPMLPISVDIDTTRTWSLQAVRQGYAEYNQPISFDDGQAEKTYVVTLEARGGPPALAYNAGGQWAPVPGGGGGGGGSPAPPSFQPQTVPRSAPPPQMNPTPVQAAAPTMGGGGGGGGEGFLNINSIPPSTVFLDGRQLGPTPKVHVSVSPGPHQVKFVNSEQNLQKTISIAVNAGETKLAVAKLSN